MSGWIELLINVVEVVHGNSCSDLMSDSWRLQNRCPALKVSDRLDHPEVFSAESLQQRHRQTEGERRWVEFSDRASVRWDLLRRLHTAMQYSSESKLLRLPAQPPYMKRTHFLWLMSKCQRGMEARQGPVSASRVHTAARGQLVRSSCH